MIKFSSDESVTKSTGIKNINKEKDCNLKLPHIAIGVFSYILFNNIIENYESFKLGYMNCANFEKGVYKVKYKDTYFTLFLAGVSAPHIAGDIEELSFHGVDTFIIFGNCGVLDKNIEDCSIIIPNLAYREEGTSYHYMKDSETIELNKEFKSLFKNILKNNKFLYTEGATWTTDAFYRETREKVNYYKNKGVICVEMEGSAIGAVCDYKKLHYFTFYYAGDNLDSITWDERSLKQEANFEKKVLVPKLAFELAYEIDKM